LEDKLITRLDSSDSVFAIVPEEENITQTDPCSSLKCPEICVLSESSIEPGAQCFCKNCAEKHAVETGNLMLSWIIITLLIFVIFGLIVFFLVMYIRLKSKIR
jgi:ABC-type sulfate transport system permease subunit